MPQVPRAVELQDAEWREGNDMALISCLSCTNPEIATLYKVLSLGNCWVLYQPPACPIRTEGLWVCCAQLWACCQPKSSLKKGALPRATPPFSGWLPSNDRVTWRCQSSVPLLQSRAPLKVQPHFTAPWAS